MANVRSSGVVARKVGRIVWAVVVLGTLFGGVEGGVLALSPFGVAVGAMFGAPVGLCCAPIGVICFWRKNLRVVEYLLAATTVPVVVCGTVLAANPFVAMLMAIGFFIITCVVLQSMVKDEFDAPGTCHKCGYDLRGSLEFSRCPECGKAFDACEEVCARSAARGTPRPYREAAKTPRNG